MKKYFEEIVILIVQLLVFYMFPMFAVDTNNSMGMIVIILLATFLLSLGMGIISRSKLKYYYPIIISFLFIPAVYVYNTEFLIIHTLWILPAAFLGVIVGNFIMSKWEKIIWKNKTDSYLDSYLFLW